MGGGSGMLGAGRRSRRPVSARRKVNSFAHLSPAKVEGSAAAALAACCCGLSSRDGDDGLDGIFMPRDVKLVFAHYAHSGAPNWLVRRAARPLVTGEQ